MTIAFMLAAGILALSTPPPKNVVLILADDMGLASLHAEHPGSGLPTPNLDRLAAEGMSFRDGHSSSAVCSPTRYSLLTGRYSWRTSLKSGIVAKWGPPLIAPDRMTIADVANTNNMRTACIGKWHLGWRWPKVGGGMTRKPSEIDYTQPILGGALEAGFDSYFGDDVPNWPPYIWIENNRALSTPSATMKTDSANGVSSGPMTPNWSLEAVLPALTERCVEFIRDAANDEEPFFLYFAMTSPHTPINPNEQFLGKSGVNRYADFVMETDWSVGEVLRALEQNGVADDTLVLFVADNGTSPKADFATLKNGGIDLRGQWRGHKADIWEGGHRVPFLVRWPGVVEPGSSNDTPVGLVDIMATVADALNQPLAAHCAEDSTSLVPLFAPSEAQRPFPNDHVVVHHSSTGEFSIREGQWKLIFCPGSGGWSQPKGRANAKKLELPMLQLYDMANDPSEKNNLIETYPDISERLTTRLRTIVDAHPNDNGVWWNKLPWPKPDPIK